MIDKEKALDDLDAYAVGFDPFDKVPPLNVIQKPKKKKNKLFRSLRFLRTYLKGKTKKFFKSPKVNSKTGHKPLSSEAAQTAKLNSKKTYLDQREIQEDILEFYFHHTPEQKSSDNT